jgi:hypothetical protein
MGILLEAHDLPLSRPGGFLQKPRLPHKSGHHSANIGASGRITMAAMANAIDFNGVCKRFGGHVALRPVGFAVPSGSLFGLVRLSGAGILGPNGADRPQAPSPCAAND